MPANCRNCGESVSQKFCPACGQAGRDARGPLLGLLGDVFSEFLSLDGRHLRTLLQLWIPGKLTELHLAGKRASHVTPVRIYVVGSLLFFLLVGFPSPDASRFNVYVDEVLVGKDAPTPGLGKLELMTLDRSGWLGQRVAPLFDGKLDALRTMPAQRLLDQFFGGLERTVPTTLIGLFPFVALGLTLLHLRRPFFYVDHLVFVLHVQSFLFMLFVLAWLANATVLSGRIPGSVTYVVAYLVLLPIYLILAMRRVYGQSWPRTLMKSALLGLFYFIIIQPMLVVTMFLVVQRM